MTAAGDDSVLFSPCHFYLLGFDEDGDDGGDGSFLALTRLLRRGMGLIHWEFHAGVTHVVVQQDADPSVRGHNGPLAVVSSTWVSDSWTAQELLDESQYPPTFKSADTGQQPSIAKGADEKMPPVVQTSPFKGTLFCLVRMAADDGAVDFDAAEMERLIRRHGGQLLSHKLVEALRVDASNGQARRRRLYAVCWGAYDRSHLDLHPLLSQVRRLDLCHLEPVTPVWLRTCASEARLLAPRDLPALFIPGARAWRALGPVHVAVSGFAGPERVALAHLLGAVAAYDDAMVRGRTTRLVVRSAAGDKYDKARKWGIPVVSVEWLYHVAQFGLAGQQPDAREGGGAAGCEDRFPPPGP